MRLSTKQIDFFLMGLFIFCLPFMFHLNLIIQLNASYSDILLIIILYWFIAKKENKETLSIVLKKYQLIILYFLLLIYFCIVSMANYVTNISIDFPYGVSAIIKLTINFLYVMVMLIFLEKYREELILFLLRWWKRAAVVIAILCIASVIFYQLGMDSGLTLGGRAQATLNDPNLAALYLIVSLSVIALASIYMRKAITINLSMVAVLIALFLTASRGGILSVAISVCVVLLLSFLSGRIKELIIFLSVVIFFFLIILWINHVSDAFLFAMERVGGVGTEGDGTSYRIFLWKSAFEMWVHNPFIGVGIGQFIAYSPEMFGFTFSNIPHNTYLSFLAETGILGFISFIWLPIYLVTKLVVGIGSSGEKKHFYLLIGILAVAIQALSINIENIRFVWVFLSLAYVIIEHKLEEQQ
ncbi:O-antigen ligase [Oceanobacillus limi]|uniref:O-antigen ligase n=1 Tax=Oceanobacillus limi TaxID=930131 RepID=A0A1I0A6L2_9BACI|nr:O-antigen ligase family protein [Oceanobacillus limi]SES89314.1 O-antigen ligase [Oceanobacillus limi]